MGAWSSIPTITRKSVPEEVSNVDEEQEIDTEQRKVKIVLNFASTKAEEVMNIKKFSSWRRLIRVTAYVRRFIRRCRKQKDEEVQREILITTNCKNPSCSGSKKHRKVLLIV